MQQNSHAEPRRAQREMPVTNIPTSATGHPTVTDRLAIQVSFSLRVSASPREPVPAFRERERPVTNVPTSATGPPTVTDRLTIQVSFSLRVSASPREPVPAFHRMDRAKAGEAFSPPRALGG